MGNKSHFFRQSSGGGGDAFIATFRTTSANESITLPYLSYGTYSGAIDWGDGTIVENTYANRTHTYGVSGDYDVTVLGELVGFAGANQPSSQKIINIKQWGNGFDFDNTAEIFRNYQNLNITAQDNPLFSNMLNLDRFAFQSSSFNCFEADMSNWDVSSINTLISSFQSSGFNGNINNWDISNVTDISNCFNSAQSFNQPLNNWDVSNVTKASFLFSQANSFNQPLNNWNTSSIQNMTFMFRSIFGIVPFNQDISTWNFSGLNNVNSLVEFMKGKSSANYDATYYDNLLIKWASDTSLGGLQPNIIGTIDMGTIKYTTNGASARASILANNKAVTINDGGQI